VIKLTKEQTNFLLTLLDEKAMEYENEIRRVEPGEEADLLVKERGVLEEIVNLIRGEKNE